MSIDLKGFPRLTVIYLGCLCWMLAYFSPYDLYHLSTRFNLNESMAGLYVTAELIIIATYTLISGTYIHKITLRNHLLFGFIIGILGLIISVLSSNLLTFAIGKALCSISIGVVVACFYYFSAKIKNPEKMFAHVGIALSLVFTTALLLIPLFLEHVGESGLEIFEIIMLIIGLVSVFLLPKDQLKYENTDHIKEKLILKSNDKFCVILIAISVFLVYVTQSADVTYAFIAGDLIKIDLKNIEYALSVAALVQLPVGILIAIMSMKIGYFKPVVIGNIILIFSAYSIFNNSMITMFLMGIALLNAGAMFIAPYQFTLLANIDPTGRSSSIVGSILNFGFALGPFIAGYIFSVTSDISYIGVFSISLLMVSLILFYISVKNRKSEILILSQAN